MEEGCLDELCANKWTESLLLGGGNTQNGYTVHMCNNLLGLVLFLLVSSFNSLTIWLPRGFCGLESKIDWAFSIRASETG